MAHPASIMAALTLVTACARKAAPTAAGGSAAGLAPTPATPLEGGATVADAIHLLARLSFGAKPGQADELAKTGLGAWLDHQLKPASIDDAAGAAALAPFADALKPFDELEDAAEQEAAQMLDGLADGERDGEKKAKNKAKNEMLANHPKTIQHVCKQLCVQLVADDHLALALLTELINL